MKVYKVYFDDSIQSKVNSVNAFESVLCEQNANFGEFYTSEAEAIATYDSISIDAEASSHHYVFTVYIAQGKLIEVAEVDDADYAAAIEDGDTLQDIFCEAGSWDIIRCEVSAPYKRTD